MAKHPKFELFTGKNGEFYFRLTASNGEPILSSEGYKSKDACLNGIDSVRKNASDPERFEKKTSSDGRFHFNLKAANHQIIGSSQMYKSEDACDNGILSVSKNGPVAEVEEV